MEQLKLLDFIEVTGIFERKVNLALNYAGLRLPHFRALDCLAHSGKITVSDLSKKLCVTSATTSVMVKQLLKAGVVETLANKSDKRSHYLRLTELGEQRLLVAKTEINLAQQKISERLPQDLIQTLNTVSVLVKDEL